MAVKKRQPSLLLDLFPNATVAYSLRKLRTAYNGNCIRVRRSSDNTEQDIGFDSSGELDTSTLSDFVGYNLFAWSEELQQPYWAKTNTTVTTDTVIAPDSTTTGDILFETTANGVHTFQRSLAVTAGSEYTVSFWVQPQGRTFIRVNTDVNLSWDGTTIPSAWINLSTGTIISQSAGYGGTFQITTSLNGWFLINYTVRAVNNATSRTIELNLSTNGSQIVYVGNPTLGVAVWGLQVTESSTIRLYRQTLAVAEGQGFVATWYDQSGNSRNATQSTAGNQPRIVNGGVIELKGLKPSLRFDGSNDFLTRNAISALNSGNNYSIFSVSSNETDNVIGDMMCLSNNIVQTVRVINDRRTTGGIYRNLLIQNNLNQLFGADLSTANGSSNQRLLSNFLNGFSMSAFDNGNIGGTATYSGTYTNNVFDIGAFRTLPRYLNGNVQEIIIYPTDQSANRTGIESNINTHYNIY
jgi:hypothetical protein